jgi:hypothetical protein
VLLQLQVEPRDAGHRVWIDGQAVEEDFFRVPRQERRRLEIVIRAPGFKTWRLRTFPAFSQNIQVKLQRRRRWRGPAPPPAEERAPEKKTTKTKKKEKKQQQQKKKKEDIGTVL